MKRLLPGLMILTSLLCASEVRADVVESFLTAAATPDSATLGVCKQLTVRTFGGGGVTVAGNGHADLSAPVATDAAFLASSSPLPQTAYKVQVTVSNINFPQNPPGGAENGVTLLAIVNTQPLPANELWWNNYRMLAVEVDATADSTNPHPMYVNYWDPSNIYTWNGTQWGVGNPNWTPVITYDPLKPYTVEIEKTGNWYTIRVSQGATLLTQASVPVPNVRPATTEYLVVGDRLTSDFNGTIQVLSVSMPTPAGCIVGGDGIKSDGGTKTDGGSTKDGPAIKPDGGTTTDGSGDVVKSDTGKSDGVKNDGGTSDAIKNDGVNPDAGPPTDGGKLDGTSKKDGAKGDKPTSWDLSIPDRGPDQGTGVGPGGSGGCDCRLPASGAPATSPLLLLSLIVLLFARRRRR